MAGRFLPTALVRVYRPSDLGLPETRCRIFWMAGAVPSVAADWPLHWGWAGGTCIYVVVERSLNGWDRRAASSLFFTSHISEVYVRLVHSYSALKLYEQCGLRYYRQRILKDVHEQETVYTTHGHVVHKAIENNINHGTPLPPEQSAYAGLVGAIQSAAARAGKGVVCEQNVGLNRAYNATGYWDDSVWIRSKIDVMVHNDVHPAAAIFDWKTGKRKVDFTQLKIAAIAAFRMLPTVDTIKASFVWLKDQLIDAEIYHRDRMFPLIQELNPRFMAIEDAVETNVWTPKPSYLCNYCPCKPTCSYALK